MGVVWKARDERLDRTVAVKQLHPQPNLSAAEAELANSRAMREARITARLVHPHAVSVFDVVDHEGQPCLIMQFLPSEPLAALIRGLKVLSPEEAARVGVQVGSALAAAHQLGIVHRDVKPGNVLIADDGTARISDFGISHALGDVTLTATGMVHGTPAFLAPEVARGGKSGFAADVFGLGATLYAAVEGAPPFGTDQNSMALLHKVASGRYDPPRRSGTLTPLLLSMLSADPEDRPSMSEVAQSLAELVDHGSTALGAAASTGAAASAAVAKPTVQDAETHDSAFTVPDLSTPTKSLPSPGHSTTSPAPGKSPPQPSSRRRGRRVVGATMAAAALLGIGILVATLLPALNRGGAETARPQPVTSQPSASATSTTASEVPPNSPSPAAPSQAKSQAQPPVYTSTTFAVPFEVTSPTWLAPKPYIDRRELVTWQAPGVAVRFLVPVSVYPPGGTGVAPPPQDYLPYLLGQRDQGARFTDQSLTSVGGRQAAIVTATADRRLYGAIGCPKAGLAPSACFGLRPERRLRIAVVDLEDRTLLIWLRNDRSASFGEQTKLFEEMLASVNFR